MDGSHLTKNGIGHPLAPGNGQCIELLSIHFRRDSKVVGLSPTKVNTFNLFLM